MPQIIIESGKTDTLFYAMFPDGRQQVFGNVCEAIHEVLKYPAIAVVRWPREYTEQYRLWCFTNNVKPLA